MAGETDPVRIVVEIVDNFSDELAELKGMLEELDKESIDVEFEISDDEEEVSTTKALLETIQEMIETDLVIDVDGAARAEAIKQMLERDMESTLHIDTDTDGGGGGLAGVADGMPELTSEQRADLSSAMGLDDMDLGPPEFDPHDATPAERDFMRRIWEGTPTPEIGPEGFGDFLAQDRGAAEDFFPPQGTMFPHPSRARLPDIPSSKFGLNRANDMFHLPSAVSPAGEGGFDSLLPDRSVRRLGKRLDAISEGFGELREVLADSVPTMMDYWNVLAMMLPLLITMAGAALGAAAALGALAAGAVAVVGAGLLGWGDSFSESLQNIQAEAKKLGSELFGVMQPVADVMQPILEDLMETTPNIVQELVGPLMGMQVFGDEIQQAFRGVVEWIGLVLETMAALDDRAMAVLNRIGSSIGTLVNDALRQMLVELFRNQDAYAKVGSILVDIIVIIFNLAKAVTFAIAQFKPLFDIAAFLSDLLSNRFVGAILAAVTAMTAMAFMLTKLGQAYITLTTAQTLFSAGLLGRVIPAIQAGVQSMRALFSAIAAAHGAWVAFAAATGAGLLVAGAGLLAGKAAMDSLQPPQSGMGSLGPSNQRMAGGNTFIQIDGNVEKKQMDRLLDEVGPAARQEMSFEEAQNG